MHCESGISHTSHHAPFQTAQKHDVFITRDQNSHLSHLIQFILQLHGPLFPSVVPFPLLLFGELALLLQASLEVVVLHL